MTRRDRGILDLAIVAYATALLTFHINDHWRLVHEDNGAMQTSFALSHQHCGLGVTRAFNVYIDAHTGSRLFYAHHPAAVPLVLAAAFAAAGDDSPRVARAVMIAFSLATLLLMMALLRDLFVDDRLAAIGGLAMATFPMESFFGRMVNYEAPVLFFAVAQLAAYLRHRRTESSASLFALASAIVLGGFFDWSSLFFTAAITIAAFVEGVSKRRWKPLAVTTAAAVAITVLNLGHAIYATGSLADFVKALTMDASPGHDPLTFAGFMTTEIENYRGYFTMSGMAAAILTAIALLLPRSRVGAALMNGVDPDVRRILWITLGAAAAYQLASPTRARIHHYWQFFFLPFAVVAFVLMIRCLQNGGRRWSMAVMVLIAIEIMTSSAYKLYRRHTRPGEWAVENTRIIERDFLAPGSFAAAPCPPR